MRQAPRPPTPAADPAHHSAWQNAGPSALHVGGNFLHLPAVAETSLKATTVGAGSMAKKYGSAAMYGVHSILGDKQEKTTGQPLRGIFTSLTIAAADKAGNWGRWEGPPLDAAEHGAGFP